MDERLPLGSPDAPTLRRLLEKEQAHRSELEYEIARLQVGLARQNEIIVRLERRDAARMRRVAEMERLVSAVTEQNTLLRQQVAALQQENARLRGVPLAPTPDPAPEVKPAAPQREPKVRKKRAVEHNRGRIKLERATRWETHAAEHCPLCGKQLAGGWIVRRVQVIELAPVAPLEVTEHRILRRQCPRCGTRVLPQAVGLLLLCPAELDPDLPRATLAKRLRRYLPELFTFIRDPQVDATNNAAERSLRPLVTARKISGGTRSQTGSSTCMVLASLAATARIQGRNPMAVYQAILLAPPGTPSPLAVGAAEAPAPLALSPAS